MFYLTRGTIGGELDIDHSLDRHGQAEEGRRRSRSASRPRHVARSTIASVSDAGSQRGHLRRRDDGLARAAGTAGAIDRQSILRTIRRRELATSLRGRLTLPAMTEFDPDNESQRVPLPRRLHDHGVIMDRRPGGAAEKRAGPRHGAPAEQRRTNADEMEPAAESTHSSARPAQRRPRAGSCERLVPIPQSFAPPALALCFAIVSDYFSSVTDHVGRAWNRFWFLPSDPLTLSVIRVLAGLIAFYTVLTFTPDLITFFGPQGLLGLENVSRMQEPTYFSFSYFWLFDDPRASCGPRIGLA